MTEKQIEKIRLSIKRNKSALLAEKRKYGGFDDSAGKRYHIADLYLEVADYEGALAYFKWFYETFPDDAGNPILYLDWSVAFYETGKIEETRVNTIETAFQNLYLHGLLLDNPVEKIDKYEFCNYESLEFARTILKDCRKVISKGYLDWLREFVTTDDYKAPVNRFIAIQKLLKDEHDYSKRTELLSEISNLRKIIGVKR